MALVAHVIGDCPGCGAVQCFGNVGIFSSRLVRGCKRCRFLERVPLPSVRKQILYLDQFFFSHAFRGGDERFVNAAQRIERLVSLQLLTVPFSSVHEDEAHQWERREELFRFIRRTARGQQFKFAHDVEEAQLQKAFLAWQADAPSRYEVEVSDALHNEVHEWDGYFRVEVGGYLGDIDLVRRLKQQSVTGLVDMFPGWRKLTTSFDEDLEAEYAASAKGYIDFFLDYMARILSGDFSAFMDAPVASQVLEGLLHLVPREVPEKERLRTCAKFLMSEHFRETPYQWLNAHMLTTLKAMVKSGDYTNRDNAIRKLSGVFFDVKHIATYAPYVDAFVVDQPMADLVARPNVRLTERYGTKIFSLNNWDAFMAWLDSVEAQMTPEHRDALAIAYRL